MRPGKANSSVAQRYTYSGYLSNCTFIATGSAECEREAQRALLLLQKLRQRFLGVFSHSFSGTFWLHVHHSGLYEIGGWSPQLH